MVWGAVILAVVLLIWGDDLLKQAAMKGETKSILVFWGALAYASTAPLWAYIMQAKSLAQVGVIYASMTLIGLYALGWLRYAEVPSNWQLASLALAIGAVITSEL